MASNSLQYSHDATIAAVTSFYDFLVRLYLPDDTINTPPDGGWDFSGTTFVPPKSEAVIDLMKHLPYPFQPEGWEYCQIYEKTEAIHYGGLGPGEKNIDPDPNLTLLPSHALMIARPFGRNGHHLFLDTERGVVVLCDFQVGPKPNRLSQFLDELPNALESTDEQGNVFQEHWREFPTFPIRDFFEMLKKQFRDLEVVPHPGSGEVEFRRFPPGVDEKGDQLKAIFHECGWPGDEYRKQECMQRVAEFDDLNGNGDDDEDDEDDESDDDDDE